MDEIKFRGQTEDNEWAFGSLYIPRDPINNCATKCFILEMEPETGKIWWRGVAPETIGQYTGRENIFSGDLAEVVLCDHNGKKTTHICEVCWDDDLLAWILEDQLQTLGYLGDDGTVFSLKVVGNITDNPELLEENGKT